MATKKEVTKKKTPPVGCSVVDAYKESISKRFAQVYEVINSLDKGVATRDKVNKVHDRVTELESTVNALLIVQVIFAVILSVVIMVVI